MSSCVGQSVGGNSATSVATLALIAALAGGCGPEEIPDAGMPDGATIDGAPAADANLPDDAPVADANLPDDAAVDANLPDDAAKCTVINGNPGFEGGVGPWVLYDNASLEDWADGDPPTYATSGDGDYGIALQGWVDSGTGGVYQDITGTAVVPGQLYTFSAWMHFEPNFNSSSMQLKLEWWNGASPNGEQVVDLAWTSGADATDFGEWAQHSVSGVAPADTTRITAVVYFAGTSDLGGLQAARVDNAVVVDGELGCNL